MLGLLPMIFVGGAALMFTDKFIRQPLQKREKRPFDKEEQRDLKSRDKDLGFGDFSNIGW